MSNIIIRTSRTGYGIDQVRRTVTVGELIDILSQYDEESKVYLSFDNGYTYGGIIERDFDEEEVEE